MQEALDSVSSTESRHLHQEVNEGSSWEQSKQCWLAKASSSSADGVGSGESKLKARDSQPVGGLVASEQVEWCLC